MDAVHFIKHYLYLPTRQAAEKAAAQLQASEVAAQDPLKTYDGTWQVTVWTWDVPSESRIAELRALMTHTALDNGGEYDGWEAEVAR
jgi:hypothetical protein